MRPITLPAGPPLRPHQFTPLLVPRPPASAPQPESPTVLTKEEVVRRLRALGEPATLFAEVRATACAGRGVGG